MPKLRDSSMFLKEKNLKSIRKEEIQYSEQYLGEGNMLGLTWK